MLFRLLFIFCLSIISSPFLTAQVVYVPVGSSVYGFLDELANAHAIELSTVTKPYSRKLVSTKLAAADTMRQTLNIRQQQELDFYLKDFGKELHPDKDFDRRRDLFYYKKNDFTVTVNPIIAADGMYNENGLAWKRTIGGEFWAYGGEVLGMYGSLRDNSSNEFLNGPEHLVQNIGGNFKGDAEGKTIEWNEANGGIIYGWKWMSIGIVKDRFVWGNNYNGANIFSGRQPSFAYIDLKMAPTKWFEFSYVHGWLVSEVLDSAATYNSGNGNRQIFFDKYLAANLFTFKPFKRVWFSFGNSIIYSGNGINPAYLIPFLFYKSVDHTYNGTGSNGLGQNSQMFFDVSVRSIKNVHLYSSLFVDEVNLSKMFDPEEQTNMFSWKIGGRMENLFIQNVGLTLEYTRTNPWTYRHEINTVTFESNNYNLGHYLRDNAQELFVQVHFMPFPRARVSLGYTYAQNGPAVDYELVDGVPNVIGLPFLESIDASIQIFRFRTSYEIINDGLLFLEVDLRKASSQTVELIPEYYQGDPATIRLGGRFGL